MTLPRRGPLTPEERLANAVRSQPVNTADGGIITRKANRRTPTQPIPADTQLGALGRIAANWEITDMGSIPASPFTIPSWPDGHLTGSESDSLSADDSAGTITVISSGVYAVNLYLRIGGMPSADPSCVVTLGCPSFGDDWDSIFIACNARGGDNFAGIDTSHYTTSWTGHPFAWPLTASFEIGYSNLDPAISSIFVAVSVQQVSRA